MNLTVHPHTTLADMQGWFQQEYPFLKILFLDKTHGWGETVGRAHTYSSSFSLMALKCKSTNSTLLIQPWMKTGDLELMFEKELGLHVQVFRNENGRWIETVVTDDFTLSEQNDIGKHLVSQSGGHLPLERSATINF